jgi:hypothetical protein
MCKRHDEETEKTHEKTETEQPSKGAAPLDHEDRAQHQDLERAALNERDCIFVFRWRGDRLEGAWERVGIDLDRLFRVHRSPFESEKRSHFAVAKRGAKTPGG